MPSPPLVHEQAALSLRAWGAFPDDADALVAAWADPAVARWTTVPACHDIEAAKRWISGEEARRVSARAVDLVIAELTSPDRILGEVGLVVVERQRGLAEVGYWLAPDARGAGRAAAAVGTFAGWALATLPISRLLARTHAGNSAAGAVAQRAGFRSAGTLPEDTTVWVLGTAG